MAIDLATRRGFNFVIATGAGATMLGGAGLPFEAVRPVNANESGGDQNGGPDSGAGTTEKVTQRSLTRMSPNELRSWASRAESRKESGKGETVIDGFTPNMSSWIIRLSGYNPRSAKRLLTALDGVSDKDKRLKILQAEQSRLKWEVDTLKKSIEHWEERISELPVSSPKRSRLMDSRNSDRRLLKDAEVALEAVDTWVKFPEEGTYK